MSRDASVTPPSATTPTPEVYGTQLTRDQLLAATHTPRIWEFTDLTDAYAEVQTNDDLEDGDVVVSQSDITGLTVGFVYHGAWVVTVYADQPTGRWDGTDDLTALVADKPEYALGASQADLTVKVIQTEAEWADVWSAATRGNATSDALVTAAVARDEAADARMAERNAFRRVRDEARNPTRPTQPLL